MINEVSVANSEGKMRIEGSTIIDDSGKSWPVSRVVLRGRNAAVTEHPTLETIAPIAIKQQAEAHLYMRLKLADIEIDAGNVSLDTNLCVAIADITGIKKYCLETILD